MRGFIVERKVSGSLIFRCSPPDLDREAVSRWRGMSFITLKPTAESSEMFARITGNSKCLAGGWPKPQPIILSSQEAW